MQYFSNGKKIKLKGKPYRKSTTNAKTIKRDEKLSEQYDSIK